ncbi:MAG: hypothetical protein ACK56I_19760, partial [bacterium]
AGGFCALPASGSRSRLAGPADQDHALVKRPHLPAAPSGSAPPPGPAPGGLGAVPGMEVASTEPERSHLCGVVGRTAQAPELGCVALGDKLRGRSHGGHGEQFGREGCEVAPDRGRGAVLD